MFFFFFSIAFSIWFSQNKLRFIYYILSYVSYVPCGLDWPLYIITMVTCLIIFVLPSRDHERAPDEVQRNCTRLQNIYHHLPRLSLCTSCFLTWNQLAPYLLPTKPCVFADSGDMGTYLCGPASTPRRETSGLSSTTPLPSPPLSRPVQSLRVYQCETRADKTAYVTAWPSSLGLGREEVKEGEPRWRQRPCQRQADVVWMMSAGKNRAGSADRGTGW